jgi:membrane associated rhomboid family serine protease
MMPLADENPLHQVPWVTMTLIAVCTALFFLVQPTGRSVFDDVGVQQVQTEDLEFSLRWAAIPCEINQGRPLSQGEVRATFGDTHIENACGPPYRQGAPVKSDKFVYLAVLVSIFLHGSVAHLVGNMLFLWVFGNNIEDRRGRLGFATFYLAAGLIATAVQYGVDPHSTVPIVGASGAIAGVMGAYLVWFPNARIKTLVILGPVLFRKIKAKWLLVVWFAVQFRFSDHTVAYAAHIGGFVFGVLAGLLWRRSDDGVAGALPQPAATARLG